MFQFGNDAGIKKVRAFSLTELIYSYTISSTFFFFFPLKNFFVDLLSSLAFLPETLNLIKNMELK